MSTNPPSSSAALPSALPRATVVLWSILAAEVLILCLPWMVWGVLALAVLGLAAVFALIYAVIQGKGASILLAWVLIFPLGYHYVVFPKDQAVITLDRILIGLLLVTVCFSKPITSRPLSPDLLNAGLCWGLYVVWALIRVAGGKAPMSAMHVLLDALLLPALLGWYVVRNFDVRRYLPTLHALTCLAAVYVAGLGFAEDLLQKDLLPVTGGGVFVAGDQLSATDILIRPNGPFGADNSLAMFGISSLLLLLFLKQVLGREMSGWQRALHRIGIAAALAAAILPLFRSVIASLVLMFVVDVFFFQLGERRQRRMLAVLAFGFVILLVRFALPAVFEERSDPMNLFGRFAAYKQTFALFVDNPLGGVGLNNYAEAAQSSKYVTSYQDVESVDSPHSSMGAVLAETGILGFLPWILSQIFLVRCFWKLRQSGFVDGNVAWRWFLFLFLGYTVNGLTLAILYSVDINYWYVFIIAVLYKFAITGEGDRLGSPIGLMSQNA
jgi:O-antigen ligase